MLLILQMKKFCHYCLPEVTHDLESCELVQLLSMTSRLGGTIVTANLFVATMGKLWRQSAHEQERS